MTTLTTGWIVVNIVLAVAVTALVAGIAVLVPHRLHRHALAADQAQANTGARGWTETHDRLAA